MFRLRGLRGPVARAILRVYVRMGSTAGLKVTSVEASSWTERGLTFKNAPRPSPTGPLSDAVRRRRWASVDVTPLVGADGPLTLALVSLGRGPVAVASRESGSHRPQLLVETGREEPGFPIRAAFYYSWFPKAWKQRGTSPYTNYRPSLGFYDSSDPAVIRRHLEAMRYGRIDAGVASWWGQGTETDSRLPKLLAAANALGGSFRWSVYYEPEGRGDPAVDRIRADLAYIRRRYGSARSYLRLGGHFVVFVYADNSDRCEMVDRWKRANTVNAYLVLKVFNGYRRCPNQPDAWHQYGPRVSEDNQAPWSFSISPGFSEVGESAPRLLRDLARWHQDIRQMIASRARFQLVTTFNEWGEGTAVESAREWQSASGYGAYLDAMHSDGRSGGLPSPSPPVIAAAGDIACDPTSRHFNGGNGTAENCRQKATSDLLVGAGLNAVLTLGDTQYEDNAYRKYLQSFDPSWGRVRAIIRPAIGNHEYLTPGATGYFQYFGAAAGDPEKGYYSFDLGSWHIIALNSQCGEIGGCARGSPEEVWLSRDLAAHKNRCVLAYWHHPRFTSGQHDDAQQMATIWNDLVAARADIVLSGHNHVYERFDPLGSTPPSSEKYQSPNLDPRGIRGFVVGTGGKNHTPFPVPPLRGEVVRNSDTYGVLKLTLHPTRYDWEFVPEAGETFSDSGTASCNP